MDMGGLDKVVGPRGLRQGIWARGDQGEEGCRRRLPSKNFIFFLQKKVKEIVGGAV